MRIGSQALRDALLGDFNYRWVADVTYDGYRRLQDVDIIQPKFKEDATSRIQGSGSCTLIYSGDFADSIAPQDVGDLLSPFGTMLEVSVLVSVGDAFTERVPYGRFMIDSTPAIFERRMRFQGGYISVGDRIELSLLDLFYGIDQDRFDTPGGPPSLASVWNEVKRLTQLPITLGAVPDAAIPTTVAYEENRLDAVYDLADSLDAVPYMTADGTVSMRPNVWPTTPAPDLIQDGDGGTLVSVGRAMSADGVYNKAVIRDNSADGKAILATAEITSGPLRTTNTDGSLSPFRRRPIFYSSQYLTNQLQAQAYAKTLLDRVSRPNAVTVPIVEGFNPLRENGDVVLVRRLGRTDVRGRVVGVDRTDRITQQTTVAVNP